MSVYVDRLPDECYCCVCNDDCWRCGISGESISHDGRREDCPLKEIVRCKDCEFCIVEEPISRGIIPDVYCRIWESNVSTDDYCSYGEKQITGKLESVEKATSEDEESTMGQPKSELDTDIISRQAAIEAVEKAVFKGVAKSSIESLPPVEDMGEVSDGYHTFNQLYHQRAVLFATIVNQNKDKAWKSWKHEDGKFCFDKEGEWFIVGVDTPEGSYTYHYEKKYWDMFDCEELDRGKHWDGHTEDDVTRLLSLPPVEPKIYGNEHNCIMTIFGECSYSETGCGSCAVVEKVRDALAKAQMKTQNSNEDAISRKVVEEMLMESWVDGFEYQGDLFGGLAKIPSVVPSVTPTERTGEWVSLFDGNEWFIHCSKCKTQHYEEDLLMGGSELPDYCPNCGAKMKGGTENDR